MRLSPHQVSLIKSTITSLVDSVSKIILFGSRVDDDAKGGDIDLYIELEKVQENRAAMASRIAACLQINLGDRKIDVILVDPKTIIQPIHTHAQQQGILL
mgnify:CR=1 FL=1